ncbi:hypothetical protein [Streptomyces sp. FIT100]|uniref:hypothetical protein n=1 Tax=Streptomyces sp. FIT100 TaxID=2837956 RepID=UPI0021CA829E|nr:hypothetical protein [Streptomyces sp. FIT100]UUN28796.1 hypothetical protein KK483_22250 [Streptomyces sp. FIT100]
MARHTLLRAAGLSLAAVGAALGGGGGTAQAAQTPHVGDLDPAAAVGPTTDAIGYTGAAVKSLSLNPLAGTPVNPLDNGVSTQVADFRSLDTRTLTGSLGRPSELPVAGPLLGGVIPG